MKEEKSWVGWIPKKNNFVKMFLEFHRAIGEISSTFYLPALAIGP